jgi:Ion channel
MPICSLASTTESSDTTLETQALPQEPIPFLENFEPRNQTRLLKNSMDLDGPPYTDESPQSPIAFADSVEKTLILCKGSIQSFLRQPVVEVVDSWLVLVNSLLTAILTVPSVTGNALMAKSINEFEFWIGSLFALEFFARWWSTTDVRRPNIYLTRPLVLVDIVVVLLPLVIALYPPSYWHDSVVPDWLTSSSTLVNLRLLRILRLQRVLSNVDTFSAYARALNLTPGEIRPWQLPLARVILSIFTLLSVATGLIYAAEHSTNPAIPDYFTALYFGLTTLTTVGFGDITPITWQGRLVVCCSILAGVTVIPAQTAVLFEALIDKNTTDAAKEQIPVSRPFIETSFETDPDSPFDTADLSGTAAKTTADSAQIAIASNAPTQLGVKSLTETFVPVLDSSLDCPNCAAKFHFVSAKFCWQCGANLYCGTNFANKAHFPDSEVE